MPPSSVFLHPLLVRLATRPFVVMGIVNVTPDSFYDGGRHDGAAEAVSHGMALAEQGADILDVGGESTRPGSVPVPLEEELSRVVPVVRELAANGARVSVDTSKAEVARQALAAGAVMVNDVTAGRLDPSMASVVAEYECPVVLMHSRGTPKTMQDAPHYEDVLAEVESELREAVKRFAGSGVSEGAIVLDPGIGFAKRLEDNLALLAKVDRLCLLGYPLLVGASRKSFIGQVTGAAVEDRLPGSLAAVAAAYAGGARMFRVHDVGETVGLLRVMEAVGQERR